MNIRLVFFTVLLMALMLPAQALQLRDPESHFFDETFGDLQEELATAKEQGKKAILIMFENSNLGVYVHLIKLLANPTHNLPDTYPTILNYHVYL